MTAYEGGGLEVQLQSFLTLALGRDEWTTHPRYPLNKRLGRPQFRGQKLLLPVLNKMHARAHKHTHKTQGCEKCEHYKKTRCLKPLYRQATAACPNPYITAVEPAGSKGD